MIRHTIYTLFILLMAPWWIFKAGLLSTVGVLAIVGNAIRKEWASRPNF